MKKLSIAILTIAVLSSISCKKFLEERSQSDIVPTTVTDFSDILSTGGYPNGIKMMPQLLLMTDDAEYYASIDPRPGDETFYVNCPAFQWQPDFIDACRQSLSPNLLEFDSWSVFYSKLMRVNVVLQYIDAAPGDAKERDRVKGEALALRAWYYFLLVNLYAHPYNDPAVSPAKSPGVPLKLDGNVIEETIARNSVAEVYAQIGKDLELAITLLERDDRIGSKVFFDDVAVHLLASRVALYKDDWEAVVKHTDYVLEHHPQLANLNAGITTSIVHRDNVETIWAYGNHRVSDIVGFAAVADFSHDLANTFDEKDLRSQYYYYYFPPEFKPFITVDYGINKYVEAQWFLNWRSSEAYLNRAEAKIQLFRKNGDAAAAQQALADLNTLRSNRFAPGDFVAWTMASGDELLKMCREERRRELCFEEGHRWFDLRRYGMPEIRHVYASAPGKTEIYVLKARDPQYTLPIPLEVLERNRALVQNTQISGVRKPE
ncbi:RagB/SusD family nutrient uptake outer membrane protein [Chitinophaga pollutisoli]|uniref:RagB/SusD family nutrient uptake outer membrane protein n=1 Tax=Chitinophaga pollutisoli TaxID=3133966 RepID=A0ABZ2YWT7_9BACT